MNTPIADIEDDAGFASYKAAAEDFRLDLIADLARLAGGRCPPEAESLVAAGALQLAASRYYFDTAARLTDLNLLDRASQFANDSRQSIVAAHDLCACEARARREKSADKTS